MNHRIFLSRIVTVHLSVLFIPLWFLKMSSQRNRTRRVESWRGLSSPAMASVGGKLSVLALLSAGFEMVARTSTSAGQHRRSVSRAQAARR